MKPQWPLVRHTCTVKLLDKCTLPQEYIKWLNCRLSTILIIRIDVVLETAHNVILHACTTNILRNTYKLKRRANILISLHCLQFYLHLAGGFFLFFSQSLSQFISFRMLLLSPCWPIICFTERGRYLSTHNKLGSPKQLKTKMSSWTTCMCMYLVHIYCVCI